MTFVGSVVVNACSLQSAKRKVLTRQKEGAQDDNSKRECLLRLIADERTIMTLTTDFTDGTDLHGQ
jgi:hypothetical protein